MRAWVLACLAACSFKHGSTVDGSVADGVSDGRAIGSDVAQPRLIDRGVIARYLIAEAASGTGPTALADATSNPLALPITYTSNLQYATTASHRGLQWTTTAADPARATAPIAGTKLAAQLAGATAWTFEVVVDVQALSPPSGIDCRILTIATGTATYGTAALVTSDLSHVSLFINGVGTTWGVTENSGRHVLHAVVDTGAANAADRTQLYVDGTAAVLGGGTEPAQSEQLVVAASDTLTVGNVDSGGRSFIGIEYYAAIYAVALSPTEVAANAAALAANDDSP